MNDNTITVSGNLIADPERRRTKSGHPMLTFRVASNHRFFNNRTGQWEEGGTNYYDVVAYRHLAVNAADSLEKGIGVHIHGHLRQRRYTRQDGTPGMSCEIEVKSLGVDLTFAVAKVWRRPKPSGNGVPWADQRTGEIADGRQAGSEESAAGGGDAGMIDPVTTAYTVNRDHDPSESYPAIDGGSGLDGASGVAGAATVAGEDGAGLETEDEGERITEPVG